MMGELENIADSAEAFVAEHAAGASIFVSELLHELNVASAGARRVGRAVDEDDNLGALVYLRIVVECTIRLRWVAGDGPEPVLATLRERIERQRARDLSRIRAALKFATDSPARRRAIALVTLEQATVRARPAPATVEQLATTDEARDLYALHRLCSAMIHPGVGIRRLDVMQTAETVGLAATTLDYAVACAASSAGVLDRGQQAD
jgi:hypothetical protein